MKWKDVARARITAPDGEVVHDQVIEHRLSFPDDADREAAVRELVARMDSTFVAERSFYPNWALISTPKFRVASPEASALCTCGCQRILHAGAKSEGRCSQCGGRCQRFRRKW